MDDELRIGFNLFGIWLKYEERRRTADEVKGWFRDHSGNRSEQIACSDNESLANNDNEVKCSLLGKKIGGDSQAINSEKEHMIDRGFVGANLRIGTPPDAETGISEVEYEMGSLG